MAGNYKEDPETQKNSALQEQQKALDDFAKELFKHKYQPLGIVYFFSLANFCIKY